MPVIETPFWSTFVAVLLCALVIAIFYGSRTQEERRSLLAIAYGSFALKVLLIPIYFYILVALGYEGFGSRDAGQYHIHATDLALEFRLDLPKQSAAWITLDPGYPVVSGVMYWLLDENPLVPRVVNSLLSVLILLYVWRIVMMVYRDERMARIAVLITAFLPFSILITINQGKDAVVQFLAIYCFYHSVKIIRLENGWQSSIFWLLISLSIMSFFRGGFLLPFVGFLLLSYAFTLRSPVQAIGLAVPALAAMIALQLLFPESESVSLEAGLERFSGKLEGNVFLSNVGGGLVRYTRVTGLSDLWKMPIAAFLILILPFPPFFRTGGLPGTLLSWANLASVTLIPYMIFGVQAIWRSPERQKQLMLVIFPLLFVIAIGVVNISVARYRETVFPALIILAAIGIRSGGNWLVNFSYYSGLFLISMLVYTNRWL